MDNEQIKAKFQKFFDASPFANADPRYRVAMYGAYMAGYILLAEELKEHIKKGTGHWKELLP